MRWSGSTALHGAATSNQQSIIRYLVDNGAKLDARNKLGWTPLMIAEGGQFGATVKEFPDAAALIRKLMTRARHGPRAVQQGAARRELPLDRVEAEGRVADCRAISILPLPTLPPYHLPNLPIFQYCVRTYSRAPN